MTAGESPNEMARRGLLKIDDAVVLAAVDSLNLRGSAKVSAVVGMPLRGLQQRRDVTAFATSAPINAVRAMLEVLAARPLERVIEVLGDHADSPNFDQLTNAVDQMRSSGSSDDDVVALLVFAVIEEFPAAPHCRSLLAGREEFHLPEVPVVETSSVIVPKEIDPEVREQRRIRREAQKNRKKNSAPQQPSRPAKVKAAVPRAVRPTSEVAPPVEPVAAPERRRAQLTPAESENFSSDHPWAGSVIVVGVPFDAVDPQLPEQRIKERPSLVVAGSEHGVLVRGIYSNPSSTRTLFAPWRRLGLDHVSYIEDARVAIGPDDFGEFTRLGRLSDAEWNALN